MYNLWNSLKELTKIMIVVFMIGLVMVFLSGIFFGIPTGICVFNFKPMATVLVSVGGIMMFIAIMSVLIDKME